MYLRWDFYFDGAENGSAWTHTQCSCSPSCSLLSLTVLSNTNRSLSNRHLFKLQILASDQGCISLLVLLEISAVFDTIDHDILIDRLQNYTGIQGQALRWFRSYLSDSYHFVYLNGESSKLSPVKHGVPQGSVQGLLLFSIYMLPLGNIIRKHGISFLCYANDT